MGSYDDVLMFISRVFGKVDRVLRMPNRFIGHPGMGESGWSRLSY